jgi:UDP-galactopyranose mutase
MSAEVVVVGAGLSGAVLAERCARVLGMRVLVLDRRDHIAGNCYDYVNEDGHLVNKYGLHLFHTNDTEVYDYIQRFGEWMRYDHKVVARVGGRLVPVPVGIETVNALCGENITTPEEMDAWLAANQVAYPGGVHNGEEAAKARVGERLYKLLFEDYTKKQWAKSPAELDKSVLERIPVRRDHDTRYFSDRYQVIPVRGYTAIVAAMLDHPLITVRLGADFGDAEDGRGTAKWVFYTGPVDQYFKGCGLPPLEYRSIRFESERVPVCGKGFAMERLVINEPSPDVPYTRTVEYKHLPTNAASRSGYSTIVREYTTDEGEPYYPVPNPANQATYRLYAEKAKEAERDGVFFVGRLGTYKYLNMDQAIGNALALFREKCLQKE